MDKCILIGYVGMNIGSLLDIYPLTLQYVLESGRVCINQLCSVY